MPRETVQPETVLRKTAQLETESYMKPSTLHLHLNPVGGISGNMFVGAMLDAFPALAVNLDEQLARAGFGNLVTLSSTAYSDGILTGTSFDVQELPRPRPAIFNTTHSGSAHPHRLWREIRTTLELSQLDTTVLAHALGIFSHLADAEAAVHGMPVEEVAFHEVGAWDSIADIVCAATLIAGCGAHSWSVSSLPAGRGLVSSAHGDLPLPAPAVLHLLEGFRFHDDQREGERVTPTGAAILRYLHPRMALPPGDWQLVHSGTGFGTRRFTGISNVLRVQCYMTDAGLDAHMPNPETRDVISVLRFMVDDQNPESLALALEQLREQPGVVDVIHMAVIGKKGRMAQRIEVLCEAARQQATAEFCLTRTSTLGIRMQHEARLKVPRRLVTVSEGGQSWRVKLAQRPDGEITAKVELDDLRSLSGSLAQRDAVKFRIEQAALEQAELAFSRPDNQEVL